MKFNSLSFMNAVISGNPEVPTKIKVRSVKPARTCEEKCWKSLYRDRSMPIPSTGQQFSRSWRHFSAVAKVIAGPGMSFIIKARVDSSRMRFVEPPVQTFWKPSSRLMPHIGCSALSRYWMGVASSPIDGSLLCQGGSVA